MTHARLKSLPAPKRLQSFLHVAQLKSEDASSPDGVQMSEYASRRIAAYLAAPRRFCFNAKGNGTAQSDGIRAARPPPPPRPAPRWDAPPGSPRPRGMAARTYPAPRRDALHAARPPAPARSRFVNAKHVGHVSGVPAAVPGVPHEETPSVGRMTPRRPRALEGRATSSHASRLTSHDFHVLRFALKRFTLYASKRPCARFDEKGGFPLYLSSADQMQS